MAAERDLDLVLYGATGFTGGLAAAYLAEHAPSRLRWGMAGRDLEKLAAVRGGLGVDVPLLSADAGDPAALAELAARTRVVATTVGPYLQYGEPLVAACAEAGTDYLDLTGEPEFVDRMYLAHHATAERTGARLVHACGFDSVPHDLGVLYTLRELGMPLTDPVRVRGVVRSNGTFSTGTFHSALGAFSRAAEMRRASAERREVESRPEGRRSRAVAGKPRRDEILGYWLLPLPTIDPLVVRRSGSSLAGYGPDFRYSHYAGTRTLRYAAGGIAGAGLLAAAAQVGPVRRRLLDRMPSGVGPSPERRSKTWFTVDFVAETPTRTLHTRVSGGDPGYDETATMLSEAAMCLALDDNPSTTGQVTTAVAMGERLLSRLIDAGMRFEVVSR